MRTMTKGSYASGLNVGAKMRGKMIIVEANNTRRGDELGEEERQRSGMCVVRRRFKCQILQENEMQTRCGKREWRKLPSVRKGR